LLCSEVINCLHVTFDVINILGVHMSVGR